MEFIRIKNMVCNRCIVTVEKIALQLAIEYNQVTLGAVFLNQTVNKLQQQQFVIELRKVGFEVLEGRKARMIENIHKAITLYIELSSDSRTGNLSTFIASHLNYDYCYLSKAFSSVEGRTIEQTFIEKQVDKVKELLMHSTFSLTEIARYLGYSNAQNLSNQFRQITGMTPGLFRKLKVMPSLIHE
jgi:AraC family transcriptional regulator